MVRHSKKLETCEEELVREGLILMVVPVNDIFKLPFGYIFINKISGIEKANIVKEALWELAASVNCKKIF